METVTLITMPVVAIEAPSIGLTQLKDVTKRAHGDRVDVRILYLHHDFAQYMAAGDRVASKGSETSLYEIFCGNQLHNTGLGDWFFRQVAFPDLPDNSKEYFARYYPGRSPEVERFRAAVLERRRGLAEYMDSLIAAYGIDASSIVGFTSMFQQNVATFAMARRLKRARPDVTILVGGANCEAPMGQEMIRNVDCLDYVFSGPALKSFPEFVGRHLAGDTAGMAAIRGVLPRPGAAVTSGAVAAPAESAALQGNSTGPITGNGNGNGHAHTATQAAHASGQAAEHAPAEHAPGEAHDHDAVHAQMGEELDIDAEVGLDYGDFIASIDRHFQGEGVTPVIFFETSRGCWWGERSHCTFCGLNGITMAYRAMQPDNAVRLIQGLFDRYADRSNYFFCVDNIMPTNYLKEVLGRVRTPPNATIFYEVKANLVEEDVRALAAAGVRKIQPGIESLASSTLKLMKKGSTSFVNLRLLKACVKHSVRPQWNLLIGFPGEGADVYEKYVRDLARLAHLYPPDGAFPVRYDRFSPYFMQAEQYGLKLRTLDYYRLTYPFEEEAVARMAYFFTDTNIGAPYVQAMLQWLGRIREKAGAWHQQWNDGRAVPPKLYLERRGDGGVIRDWRNGQETEHAVSARHIRMLEQLETPRSDETLRKELGADIEGDLAWLDERGLVWKEGDRSMSVVLLEAY